MSGGFEGKGISGSGGGGVGSSGGGFRDIYNKLEVLEFNQNKILIRLEWLESAQDEKSEPESLPVGHSLSKEQIEDKQLFNKQHDIEELKKLSVKMQTALDEVWQERDRYKNQLVLKQKALEEVIIQRDERHKELQEMYSDLKSRFDNQPLVEKQTARSCLGIVTRIKNEPLTTVSTHREWMVAICEDIEKEIKKEFGL